MNRLIFNAKTISIPESILNAKEWPKTYTCRFIEPGLVSYRDVGAGLALVTKGTLDRMLNSIIGKPVIIQHTDVTPQNMKQHAIGYVTNAYFDSSDGWYYCTFLVTDDEGHEYIKNGASVSCGYTVRNTNGGGEWHAIRYDEEITDGEYEHLALVRTPRYEDSRILVNSKTGRIIIEKQPNKEANPMFGFLKKKNEKGELEKMKTDLSTHFVRLENGDKISLKELMELRNSKNSEEKNTLAVEDVIETESGEEVKISDLLELRNSKAGEEVDPKDPTKQKWAATDKEKEEEMEKKKNAEGEEAGEKEEKEREEKEEKDAEEKLKKEADKKKNEAEEEKKKKEEEEEQIKKHNEKTKKDNEHFIKLNSLRNGNADEDRSFLPSTLSERTSKGSDRYGKK